jgi:hypothetical protein
MSLRARAISWPSTLDSVTSVEVFGRFLHTKREGTGIYAASLFCSTPVTLRLVRGDTVFVCTTGCQHLVGYQLRCGGDTTRLGVLDLQPGWSVTMPSLQITAVTLSGARLSSNPVSIVCIPDTVRAGAPVDLDMTFDMTGFITWSPAGPRPLLANAEWVSVRQR